MNFDSYLYQTWLDFMQVKKTNAYCLAIGEQQDYPLCARHIMNLKFVKSSDVVGKLYHLFQVKYTARRSVFAQRRDWGFLAACEALALLGDGQTGGYVYVIGVDKATNDFICFDPCTTEHPVPLVRRLAIPVQVRLHNQYDRNIYAIPPLSLQKGLFGVILDTKYMERIGDDTDVIYDDYSRLNSLLHQKGLSLYESWFTRSIVFGRTLCVVNADKYEVDDILLAAEPKYARMFQENLLYSDGEKITAMIFQLWNREDGYDDDILALIADGGTSHAITVTGIEAGHDLILYFDSEFPTLLTPQCMPLLDQGGFAYKNAYAISKLEFAKIVYAIMISDEQN